MSKMQRIVPIVLLAGALFVVSGCSSYEGERESTPDAVADDTGSTVGSVLDGVGSVVMYPFHVVADIL